MHEAIDREDAEVFALGVDYGDGSKRVTAGRVRARCDASAGPRETFPDGIKILSGKGGLRLPLEDKFARELGVEGFSGADAWSAEEGSDGGTDGGACSSLRSTKRS